MSERSLPSAAYDTQQRSQEQLSAGTYGDFVADGSCDFTVKIDGTRCPSMVRVDYRWVPPTKESEVLSGTAEASLLVGAPGP